MNSMRVERAYKTELDPTNEQRTLFAKHAGVARYIYNWGLARRQEVYGTTGKSLSYYKQNLELTKLKAEIPWLNEVSSQTSQGALQNLATAFHNFFEYIKKKKNGLKGLRKVGHPQFKTRKRGRGSFKLYGIIHVEKGQIQLPKFGWIKLKEYKYLPCFGVKLVAITVSEKADRWFVSMACKRDIVVPRNKGPAVGVDLGLKTLAMLSDGTAFANPRPLRRMGRKIKRAQRVNARRVKGSNNRRKSARRLARLYHRSACIRADTIHKITSHIAKNHSLVAIEDLNVSGMMKNHCLAQALGDASFAEFRRQLEYKCQWYGSRLVVIDRFYPSTKTCSRCGHVKEFIALSERVFQCEVCGLVEDRDLNASRSILVAASKAETLNACGAGKAQAPVLKQEPATGQLVGAPG